MLFGLYALVVLVIGMLAGNWAGRRDARCELLGSATMKQYRHYKGGLYSLVCEAKLESDPGIVMIVYRAADGSMWSRPSDVFFELVEFEGKKVPRFSPA